MIWTYALAVDVARVVETPTYDIICNHSRDHAGFSSKGGGLQLKETGLFEKIPCYLLEPMFCCASKQKSSFHLPEVCRQIYSETATLAYHINTFLLSDEGYNPKWTWAKYLTKRQRNAITSIRMSYCDIKYFVHGAPQSLTARTFPNLERIWITEIAVTHYKTWVAFLPRGGTDNPNQPFHTPEERDRTCVEFFDSIILPKLNELHGDGVQVILIKSKRSGAIETESDDETETEDD